MRPARTARPEGRVQHIADYSLLVVDEGSIGCRACELPKDTHDVSIRNEMDLCFGAASLEDAQGAPKGHYVEFQGDIAGG